MIGGDNRNLNGTTLVNGLQTARIFDFDKDEIIFAQNISSARWCAPPPVPDTTTFDLQGPGLGDAPQILAAERL